MIHARLWKLVLLVATTITTADAFAPLGGVGRRSTSSTTRLFAALPEGYKEFGDAAILQAAKECGMKLDEENGNRLDIRWKAGTIVVTVHGNVSLRAIAGETDDDDEDEEDTIFGELEEEDDDIEEEDDDDIEEEEEEEFSLMLLARTINKILDDDGIGLAIAEAHSIEVTTPGVSDELVPGTPEFEAFMGFEVIVEQIDNKTKKIKKIEGRLYEHTDEITTVNIKGRMKKIKNNTIVSVRLPKAKKEKGGK